MVRRAAFVLVAVPDGRVLGITRGRDLYDWSLPGGKVERGETFVAGAVRELAEETGVVATSMDLHEIHRFVRQGTAVVYYTADSRAVVWPERLTSHPFEGYVALVSPRDLVANTCRFRLENALALEIHSRLMQGKRR